MTIWIGAGLVLLAIAFVLWPLFRPSAVLPPTQPIEARLRRAALYREILDAELDQQLGKLTLHDYVELRDQLLERAAQLLSDGETTATFPVEQLIEAEIAAVRGQLRATPNGEGASA